MSDGKRRRYRKTKEEKPRPIILAKREESSSYSAPKAEAEIQPKILLKTKPDKDLKEDTLSSLDAASNAELPPLKTIIVTRSEVTQSPALSTASPNTTKEQQAHGDAVSSTAAAAQTLLVEPVPQMTRPATVISSTGLINSSARKLLMKSNTDFLVVGVIGTQGVGKSTVMNLLANEQDEYDYYQKVFLEEESVFPTKLKLHKCSARSRTESTHMFITSDRMILLDSPPVLCNSYKKDMTTNELDDLRNIISFLSVCHLLIVVQDDYFNMNFMRLLQFAELMKPTQDNKPLVGDYFPNVLFVQNRAKRHDFAPDQQQCMNRMLKTFFKDSQLRVFVGQTTVEQHLPQHATPQRARKGRLPEAERIINSFLLPEVRGATATPYHAALVDVVEELRRLVFMTPRNEMYAGPTELTEAIWFELLTKVSQDTQHFFFNTYEDIQRKHLEVGASETRPNASGTSGGGGGGSSNKDMHDNWRE